MERVWSIYAFSNVSEDSNAKVRLVTSDAVDANVSFWLTSGWKDTAVLRAVMWVVDE